MTPISRRRTSHDPAKPERHEQRKGRAHGERSVPITAARFPLKPTSWPVIEGLGDGLVRGGRKRFGRRRSHGGARVSSGVGEIVAVGVGVAAGVSVASGVGEQTSLAGAVDDGVARGVVTPLLGIVGLVLLVGVSTPVGVLLATGTATVNWRWMWAALPA